MGRARYHIGMPIEATNRRGDFQELVTPNALFIGFSDYYIRIGHFLAGGNHQMGFPLMELTF